MVPPSLVLLLGVDVGTTPYGKVAFTPETECVTTSTSNYNPFAGDIGTTSSTDCVTAAGWDGARAPVGDVFPALTAGFGYERDRVSLTALFTLGPLVGVPVTLSQGVLTPDLALGGDLSLEYVAIHRHFSLAAGALANLRGFEAHGTNDDGDARLGAEARLGAGPVVTLGWAAPRLALRLYGVYTTEGQLGGGVSLTWAAIDLPG